MEFSEALLLMKQGRHIRRKSWCRVIDPEYIYIEKDQALVPDNEHELCPAILAIGNSYEEGHPVGTWCELWPDPLDYVDDDLLADDWEDAPE